MVQPAASPSLDVIQRHNDAVSTSCAMLAGMQLDLFTPLANRSLSCEQLANAIGVDPARLRPLLYVLVVAELLQVEQERFSNTAVADHHLVRGKPAYMGGVHELWADLWRAMLNTAESIRTGRAQAKHDFTGMPPAELKAIFRGLAPAATRHGRLLVDQFDFSESRRLLDAGGGFGHLAIAVTEACP